MGIKHGKILYCYSVSEKNVDWKISALEYNNRRVYDCFNNPFTADCGIRAMHLPTITIDDRPPTPHPTSHKRYRITPYLIPAAIYVASENYVSTFNSPSDSPDILPTDDPNDLHVMRKYMFLEFRLQIGYYSRTRR